MLIGLGSGSTAEIFVAELGRRVAAGLRVVGVPTSRAAERLALRYGMPLTELGALSTIDLTVDGADEIDLDTFNLIKGHGGALVREKLVARASAEEIIIADASKLVERLSVSTHRRARAAGQRPQGSRRSCRPRPVSR
jgi:ribose 5-phosphate isomerase A